MPRITAGLYKNRLVPTIKGASYRPSTSKFREAVFSVLSSGPFFGKDIIKNARVLDLYSGTGILSFEALSRGAGFATLVDIEKKYLALSKKFALDTGWVDKTEFLNLNALNPLPNKKPYGLIFLDPPYGQNLAEKTLENILKSGLAQEGCVIVAELSAKEGLPLSGAFTSKLSKISERTYGNTKMAILKTPAA